MASQIQLTFLFVVVACMVHGTPLTVEQSYFIDDVEIRANLDKVVDALLPSIRKIILKSGMDPMRIPDISENIFPDLPGKLKGNVDLMKGWMQNLSHIKRTKHVTAIYKDKSLTLDMNLGFDVMDFNYEYNLKYLLYKRQGDIYGRLHNVDINTVITIDLNEYELILDSLKFSNVRKYDIQFEGHLLDPLVNALTKLITLVFRSQVLTLIEQHATLVFDEKIDEWNTIIPKPNRTEIINTWLNITKVPL